MKNTKCTKKKFADRKEAKDWMRQSNKLHINSMPLINVYKCLDCGRWHVTTMSREESQYRKDTGMIQQRVSDELKKLREQVSKNKHKKD